MLHQGVVVANKNGIYHAYVFKEHKLHHLSTDLDLRVGDYINLNDNGEVSSKFDDDYSYPTTSTSLQATAVLLGVDAIFPGRSLPFGPRAAWTELVGWVKETNEKWILEFRNKRVVKVNLTWDINRTEWTITTYEMKPSDTRYDQLFSMLNPSVFEPKLLDQAAANCQPTSQLAASFDTGRGCLESFRTKAVLQEEWKRAIVMQYADGCFFLIVEGGSSAIIPPNAINTSLNEEVVEVGSFLEVILDSSFVAKNQCVKEYRVANAIEGVDTQLYVSKETRGTPCEEHELRVRCDLEFIGKSEIMGGRITYYGENRFFGRVYDSYNLPQTIISTRFRGLLWCYFRSICHPDDPSTRILQVMQIGIKKDNNKLSTASGLESIKKLKYPQPAVVAPLKKSNQYEGLVSAGRSPSFISCKGLSEDVIVPSTLLSRYPFGFWLGKWVSFDTVISRGRLEVDKDLKEIAAKLPTVVLAHNVNIHVTATYVGLQSDSGFPMMHLIELEGPIFDRDGAIGLLGMGLIDLWIEREFVPTQRWRVSRQKRAYHFLENFKSAECPVTYRHTYPKDDVTVSITVAKEYLRKLQSRYYSQ